ncbi:MAG: DUF2064 domain-containing protein [Sediminicola sp.]
MEPYSAQQTAILLFTRSPLLEWEAKPFGKKGELLSLLNGRALNTVKNCNLPFYIIDENEQRGSTFGERFVNALVSVFEKGHKGIIAIGNDTPSLKTAQLRTAAKIMESGRSVLGPSTDGGFYLLGVHRSTFEHQSFVNLPWCTNKLATSLVWLLESSGSTLVKLRRLLDLDTLEDLRAYMKGHDTISSIKYLLVRLFTVPQMAPIPRLALIYPYHRDFPHNKGSPENHRF